MTAAASLHVVYRDDGPIMPGDPPCRRHTLLVAPLGSAAVAVLLTACMPTGPDARRAAYLDCARAQGLTVVDGTIQTRTGAELARLDACQAVPR